MFESIIDFSLRNRGAVLFFSAAFAVWGYLSFRDLTIEAFPDPTDTQINVITLFTGQSSEEVERQIGLPLERALNGTPGLQRLRNLSLFGLSFVTLTFRDGVDVLSTRQQVLERLRGAPLPDGVVAQLGPLATPIGEIYRYTLKGVRVDPMQLRTLQDWVVRPALMRVDGVADVVTYGGLVKQYHVQPDSARLVNYNLTLRDVETAIAAASVNASGGVLERGAEQFVIRSEGLFGDIDDLKRTRVGTRGGAPIYLSDVATVTLGWAPRQGVVSRGTTYEAVEGIVLMRRGENPSVVLPRVRDAIRDVNSRLAGDGVRIDPFYDRTELVQTTLRTVGRNLAEGALLVVAVLFVFLLDLKAALIVALLIPFSLLTSFIYLKQRGMAANLLSMGAVDFGIIVDGGVVIVESILARLHHREPHAEGAAASIREGCIAVIRPTVFSLLIIIAAYLPIFMLERVEGRIFAPMANTVASALGGALLFSCTLVPALAMMAYRRGARHRESALLRVATRLYQRTLASALRRPNTVLGFAGAALAATLLVLPHLGSEFLPELNEGGLYLTFTLPSNISLTEGRKLVPRLTELISKNPQVESVLSQLGRPEDGTDATLSNNLEFFVKLRPPEQWPKETPTLGHVIGVLHHSIDEVPGVDVNFSQPIRDNVNESISGQFGQIAVKLYGDDLSQLQEYAEQVKREISRVSGVADLGIVKSGEVPQVHVTPDRVALARYGLNMQDFQDLFQTALGGQVVGEMWEGERSFDIVMRLSKDERDDIEKVRHVRVAVPGGALLPLEELADVSFRTGRASINRENGRRYIGIRMNVRGRDLGGFVEEARALVYTRAPAPNGVSVEWGGEFENKERAMKRLLLVIPVALLITLILLFRAFAALAPAVITLLNVPFALVGGVFALYLTGMTLSVAAAVGFIALIGQASLNGVLVLSAIREREARGEVLEQAIARGCIDRLRPILMTGALAALGLVPAALSRGIGSETQRPIAVVIVAGTLSAMFLTLVVLPVMYQTYSRISARVRRSKAAYSLFPGR